MPIIQALWKVETRLVVHGHALLSCSSNDVTDCSKTQDATIATYFGPYGSFPSILRQTSEPQHNSANNESL